MKFSICLLHVFDMEKALSFYRDALGFPVRFASDDYVEFDLSPATIALHRADSLENSTRGAGLFILVDDVDALVERLSRRGLEPIHPLTDQDFGYRTVMYLDPNGNKVELATPLK